MKRLFKHINPFKILFKLFLLVSILISILILYLRFVPINTSAFIMQQNMLAKNQPKLYLPAKQKWIDIEDISPYLMLGAIASEDQLFTDHHGFDFDQILSSIKNHKEGKKLRGASTITQQTVKNLFLWGSENKIKRKIIEASIVPFMELWWNKHRIIEVYLNIAQFSNRIYGVELASLKFFHKSAKYLTEEESALLIAVLPAPSKYSISNPSRKLLDRQQWVLKRMKNIYTMGKIRRFLKSPTPLY